jgi:hypothetical protein
MSDSDQSKVISYAEHRARLEREHREAFPELYVDESDMTSAILWIVGGLALASVSVIIMSMV